MPVLQCFLVILKLKQWGMVATLQMHAGDLLKKWHVFPLELANLSGLSFAETNKMMHAPSLEAQASTVGPIIYRYALGVCIWLTVYIFWGRGGGKSITCHTAAHVGSQWIQPAFGHLSAKTANNKIQTHKTRLRGDFPPRLLKAACNNLGC